MKIKPGLKIRFATNERGASQPIKEDGQKPNFSNLKPGPAMKLKGFNPAGGIKPANLNLAAFNSGGSVKPIA